MSKVLQLSHVAFSRTENGEVVTDIVWLKELQVQTIYFGSMTVLAPEIPLENMKTWGPSTTTFKETENLKFVGIPELRSKKDFYKIPKAKSIIEREVKKSQLVQVSNVFPPYDCLSHGIFYGRKVGKKTLMVVAEDFYDMLNWEWVRTASNPISSFRRKRYLESTHKLVCKMLNAAALSFINTPSAVFRYRTHAMNSVTIRHTNHSKEDVISEEKLKLKQQAVIDGRPLKINAMARHNPIKGMEFFIYALRILKEANIPFEANLYGFGELTDLFKAQAEKFNLLDSLNFPGSVSPGDELYQVMRDSDILIMPHRTNDFGRTFYESMVGGTPVVAFETECSANTVYRNEDGLLVPLDNAIALAQAMIKLNDDRHLLAKLMEGARKRALVDTKETWLTYRANKINELLDE